MNNLFAYGSLMCADIFEMVTGGAIEAVDCCLHGYQRVAVKNESYPAVFQSESSTVDGVLYRGISEPQFKLLDQFEGNMYIREQVTVLINDNEEKACVYAIHPGFTDCLTMNSWSFEYFLRHDKTGFINEYAGF